ncbi:hypothetical protein CYY_007805 [Polysphondylium violaceum]|uniref:Exonuclease domain-containing protein n=1 Tax=Polysphondylium violaceum TaxID=133409 RepID=A0A8J4PP44_9MYCE|nr:hypothetical protein CYY_007805 [Polysphondylium violaceum]
METSTTSTTTSTSSTDSTSTSTTTTSTIVASPQKFKYLVILDFEATCEQDVRIKNQEIIEFPSVLINTQTLETISQFREYVRPVCNPILSKFCTELTGITNEQTDKAETFPTVLKNHYTWLRQCLPEDAISEDKIDVEKVCFVTCGDWDLNIMLPGQLKIAGQIPFPYYFKQWINIKKQYQAHYNARVTGMTGMLHHLRIELEGRHHCGLSDCLNITKICKRMITDKCNFDLLSFKPEKQPKTPYVKK